MLGTCDGANESIGCYKKQKKIQVALKELQPDGKKIIKCVSRSGKKFERAVQMHVAVSRVKWS